MEINARVYAIADSLELLRAASKILESETGIWYFVAEEMKPNIILPLTRTWHCFSMETGMTTNPQYGGDWGDCLQECAQLLMKRGAVIVQFWSPDHPDSYQEYARTTAQGSIIIGYGCSLSSYKKAMGNDDIRMVYNELLSGRTQYERDAAAKRKEKQEAIRKERGDFDIVAGVLKKYRGTGKEVILPGTVTEIGEFAFVDKRGLEKMVFDLEEYDAPALETLVIPDGVRKIGTYALAYCTNLVAVSIPDSVAVIEERAFEGCETLKKVTLPKTLTEISEYTFFLCDGLESVIMPEGLEQIGPGAFDSCMKLKRAVIPENVTRIGKEAFSNCRNLTSISIPKGVEQLDTATFKDCVKLSSVKLQKGLKRIGDEGFKTCRNLKKIILPESLEEIGDSAFSGCYALENVVLPKGLKRIGAAAFKDCQNLREVNIPDSLIELREDAGLKCLNP